MKKMLALILAMAMMVCMLAGCGTKSGTADDNTQQSAADPAGEDADGTGDDTADPEEGKNIKIGMTAVMYALPFFQNVANGLKDSLREGDELVVYDFQADVSTMVSNMEDIVTKQFDVMVYDGFDQDAIQAPLAQAADAGVICFNYDFPASSENTVSSIVSDDYGLGYQAGQYFAKMFHEEGKFGMYLSSDSATASSEYQRALGFEEAIAEYPNMEIVVNLYPTTNSSDDAMSAMEAALQAHPDLDGFFSANEWVTIGAVQAIKSASLEVPIVAVDVSETLLGYLQEGAVVACEDQQAYLFGQMIAETIYAYLDGEAVDEQVLVPIKIVDQTNMSEYISE